MNRVAKFVCSLGCLTSIVAPLLAVLLYPKANWLFALVLIGVAVLILNARFAKDPIAQALADEIERLLTGHYGGWDVDNFEHRNIRDPHLRDLWHRTMKIGGLPEEWVRLNEEQKGQLRDIMNQLREKSSNGKS